MKKQSAEEIDTVSGATYSSKGLIEATQNALKEAAGDENTVQENTASESTDTTEEKQAFLDAGRFHDLKDGICTGTCRCLPRGCRSAGNGRKPESDRHLHPFLLRHRGILFPCSALRDRADERRTEP